MPVPAAELVYGVNPVEAVLDDDPSAIARCGSRRAAPGRRASRIGSSRRGSRCGAAIGRPSTGSPPVRGTRGWWRGCGSVARRTGRPSSTPWSGRCARTGRVARRPSCSCWTRCRTRATSGPACEARAAAGAAAVVVPRRRSAGLTAAVRRTASGGAERVPVVDVPNLARALRDLAARGVTVAGADPDAPLPAWNADLGGPLALVLGAEEGGLRRLTREHCDHLVAIPMTAGGASLNVSVAAGILLYEALRQRRARPPGGS